MEEEKQDKDSRKKREKKQARKAEKHSCNKKDLDIGQVRDRVNYIKKNLGIFCVEYMDEYHSWSELYKGMTWSQRDFQKVGQRMKKIDVATVVMKQIKGMKYQELEVLNSTLWCLARTAAFEDLASKERNRKQHENHEGKRHKRD